MNNVLIRIFEDREGPDCPATQEARRILEDPFLGNDREMRRCIIKMLRELEACHRALDGNPYDHRSPMAERARRK